MDIINITCLAISLLPFLFGMYLIISRLNLSCVNKSVLACSNIVINSVLFAFFAISSIFIFKNNINFEYNFLDINYSGFEFNFGFLMSPENMGLVSAAALCYLLISIYSKKYFEKKKQFLFTKQRYFAFLAILAFNTYWFLLSKSMFQMLIFWILQGAIIFIFSYFDIFKNSVNFNITRFNRINLVGDFAFIAGILVLFKYATTLELDVSGINLLQSNEIFNEVFTNCIYPEAIFCLVVFLLAVMTRLYILPFNCYFSFFANSSDIFYLCVSNFVNSVFGLYLFFIIFPYIELFDWNLYLGGFFVVSSVISIFLAIFEKNIKIILGYLISFLGGLFLAGSMFFEKYIIAAIYFLLMTIVSLAFMKLAYEGKINIKPKFYTKKKTFLIERMHIFVFEKLPLKISKIVDVVDRFLVQNIILFFIDIFDFFIQLFVVKIKSKDRLDYIRAIFLVFALVLILAIFIAFFGSGRYNSELIN